MKILVFTKNDISPPSFPDRPNLECRHVRFESTNLDDLLLIAKYRIIQFPMSIIIDGRGRVLMKIKGTIPESYIDNIMEDEI